MEFYKFFAIFVPNPCGENLCGENLCGEKMRNLRSVFNLFTNTVISGMTNLEIVSAVLQCDGNTINDTQKCGGKWASFNFPLLCLWKKRHIFTYYIMSYCIICIISNYIIWEPLKERFFNTKAQTSTCYPTQTCLTTQTRLFLKISGLLFLPLGSFQWQKANSNQNDFAIIQTDFLRTH